MRSFYFFLVASLVACSNDLSSDLSDGSQADPDAVPASAAVVADTPLRAGVYDTFVDGFAVNDCGLLADGLVPQSVTLEWLDAERFVWLDGTECSVDASSEYVCDMTTFRRGVARGTQLLFTTYAAGSIVDAETIEEEQEVVVHCEGPGCDDYAAYVGASFPCEMVAETTPTWRRP